MSAVEVYREGAEYQQPVTEVIVLGGERLFFEGRYADLTSEASAVFMLLVEAGCPLEADELAEPDSYADLANYIWTINFDFESLDTGLKHAVIEEITDKIRYRLNPLITFVPGAPNTVPGLPDRLKPAQSSIPTEYLKPQPLRLTNPRDWRSRAACMGVDINVFFPLTDDETWTAKRVCQACSVSEFCLNYALVNGEKEGIWGGLTEKERRSLLRSRRRNASVE